MHDFEPFDESDYELLSNLRKVLELEETKLPATVLIFADARIKRLQAEINELRNI